MAKNTLPKKTVVADTCFLAHLFNPEGVHHETCNEIINKIKSDSENYDVVIPSIVASESSGLGLSYEVAEKLSEGGIFKAKNYTIPESYLTQEIMRILKASGRAEYKKNRSKNDYGRKWDEFTDDIKIIEIAKTTKADYILTIDKAFIENVKTLKDASFFEGLQVVDFSDRQSAIAILNGGQVSLL